MDRNQKAELVASLNGVFSSAGVVVVTHYSGLNVAEMTDLRAKMLNAGASFKVSKNRMAKLALEGTTAAPIAELFSGPTAIAWSDDPVAAPKIIAEFAKDNDNLVILGGVMGDTVLDANGVQALAKLPSLDELRGKIVGIISTPATRIAAITAAPAGQLARVFGAYGSSDAA